ncbi:hypothetical protein PIB30_085979, partial [Stylosanthes scabra]|nr:hypothetical protein [Stylosanthes scabra]
VSNVGQRGAMNHHTRQNVNQVKSAKHCLRPRLSHIPNMAQTWVIKAVNVTLPPIQAQAQDPLHLRVGVQNSGNREKKTLNFDPEIERTLHKLRKQSKLQKQACESYSEEVFEEVLVNMAEEGNQRRTLGDFSISTTAS